jgi:GR25 family glycosyltransferase involved in LPS biosynthesis
MILITYYVEEYYDILISNLNTGLFTTVYCYTKCKPIINVNEIINVNIIWVEDPKFKLNRVFKILNKLKNKICMIINPETQINSFKIKTIVEQCMYKTIMVFNTMTPNKINMIIDTTYITPLLIKELIHSKKASEFKILDITKYIDTSIQVTNVEGVLLTETNTDKLNNTSIYCINLERATERKLRMLHFFNDYSNFSFIDAVDGNNLPKEYKYNINTKKNVYEIALVFSHLKAIKQAFDKGLQYCLICEDDMNLQLLNKWDFDLQFIISNAPSDWEILQLNTNNVNLLVLLHDHFNKTNSLFVKWCGHVAWSTGFYLINTIGMKKILDLYFINNTFDITNFSDDHLLVSDIVIYKDVNTYTICKPIIIDDAFNSYIHEEHTAEHHCKAKQFVLNLYKDANISFSKKNIYDCENIIFLNGFWEGFADKTDGVHIGLLEKLFINTKLENFRITNNIVEANILVESIFSQSLSQIKLWRYKIQLSGESRIHNNNLYTFVLAGFNKNANTNIITYPFGFQYIHNNNLLNELIVRPIITIVPKHFCCFIVSNPNCEIRNKMFRLLSQYKKVHSYGKHLNNMNTNLKMTYWSTEYIKYLKNYKFVICFENQKMETYITEKIVNPFIARSIPIYWGTEYIHMIFNQESFLYLENESDIGYTKLINKIKELDTNDELYLKMINEPIIKDISRFSIESISAQINTFI